MMNYKNIVKMAQEKIKSYETGGFDIMKQFQKKELKKQKKTKKKG